MGNGLHVQNGKLALKPPETWFNKNAASYPESAQSLGLAPNAPLEDFAKAYTQGMQAAPDQAAFHRAHLLPEAKKAQQLLSAMTPNQINDLYSTTGAPSYQQIMNAPVTDEMRAQLLNSHNNLVLKNNQSAAIKTGGLMAPSEYRAFQKMTSENMSPDEGRQQETQAALRGLLEQYKAAPRHGLNEQALAAGINDVYGRNLDVKAFSPGESEKDRLMSTFKLQDAINSNDEQVLQRKTALLNALKVQPNVYNFGGGAEVKPQVVRQPSALNPQKEIAGYTDKLAQDKVPELNTMLSAIEAKIPKTGDFAGAGVVTNTIAKIPYVGTPLLPDKAKEFRLSLVALQNAMANKLFGSRQTESEIKRLDAQLASGIGYTANDMRQAIASIREQLNMDIQNRHNALSPEAKQLYSKLPGAIAPGMHVAPQAPAQTTPLGAGGGGFMDKLRLP